VGLHLGDLMLGIIGSEERMQGAVVSDDVNLAARLEGLTRVYGSSVTLSELTFSQLKDPHRYMHRFVDKVSVKGKKKPVSVYEVYDGDPNEVAVLKEETKGEFEAGLQLYYDRTFSEASVKFSQVLQKKPGRQGGPHLSGTVCLVYGERRSGRLDRGGNPDKEIAP
jgi:hypothetical protein